MMKGGKLKYRLYSMKGYINALLNRFLPVKLIFTRIYRQRKKQHMESLSGPGSKLKQTVTVVSIVSSIIRQYKIESILDIPCGDFNWMKNVDLNSVFYQGADILDELIEINQRKYGAENRIFSTIDLLKDKLPNSELILCRDCLVHFSYNHIGLALNNIKTSGATYLLTTTFPGSTNHDVTTGDWFMLDLQAPPFFFPEPIRLFNEGYNHDVSGNSAKSLGLWKIKDLP